MSALTKPLFALAPDIGSLLAARVLDRVGKGIRGAPCDARGRHRTAPSPRRGLRTPPIARYRGGDSRPLLAVGLMLLWSDDFRSVFWVAVIPGIMAVFPVVRCAGTIHGPVIHWDESITKTNLLQLKPAFWWVVGIGFLFTLARFSEAFLVLRAQQGRHPPPSFPSSWWPMNVVYSASASPVRSTVRPDAPRIIARTAWWLLIAADLVLPPPTTGASCSAAWRCGDPHGMTQVARHHGGGHGASGSPRNRLWVFSIWPAVWHADREHTGGVPLLDRLGAAFTFYAGACFCSVTIIVAHCAPAGAQQPARFACHEVMMVRHNIGEITGHKAQAQPEGTEWWACSNESGMTEKR